MGKPLDEYTDEEWEAEKAEARRRSEEEAAARPIPTFEERLADLSEAVEPDLDGVCTADQLLGGITLPREMTFGEFLIFTRECSEDLQQHVNTSGSKREFTEIGHIRVDRFFTWLVSLPNPEWILLAFRGALSLHRLPLKSEKISSWPALQEIARRYF